MSRSPHSTLGTLRRSQRKLPDAAAFDWLCTELERTSSLDRLEARGTVRIALKQSGLDARNVTRTQIQVVIERILPGELRARGVDGSDSICAALARGIKGQALDSALGAQSPDEIFRRLGGE